MTKNNGAAKSGAATQISDPAAARLNGKFDGMGVARDDFDLKEDLLSSTCAIPHGRGKSGKTLVSRLMVECAMVAGRPLSFSDADRANAGLKDVHKPVDGPESASLQDLRTFVQRKLETQLEGNGSSLIDFGAGNPVFEGILDEVDLSGLMRDYGKQLLIFSMIGPARGDVSYIEPYLNHPSLASADFVICCNEGLTDPGREISAFDPYLETQQIRAALERGGRLVRLPRLTSAEQIETLGLTYLDAALGRPNANGRCLAPFAAAATAKWLRALPKAFAPIADWMSFAPIGDLVAVLDRELAAKAAARSHWRVAP
ncbi:hypothetical protein [Methylobacterium sp. J-076]|uniref:hypothetical protein n=1 Tax=Methylobacterium sp. J-076 TaxID=2836655 RepID=UPI001FBAC351|nr:hypothetical protein [Methylobacterium sp. J-076]MCJ2012431.1 hypothetical protein [Methylobacterium sp. J-076]